MNIVKKIQNYIINCPIIFQVIVFFVVLYPSYVYVQ